MKSKLLKSIGIAILCLAVILGNVLAFSLGTTDGVWGRIDSDGSNPIDATCGGYAASTSANYTMVDIAGVVYNTNVGPGGEDEIYTRKNTVCSGDIDGDMNWTDWNRTTTISYNGLGSYAGCASTTGLFISEIVYDDDIPWTWGDPWPTNDRLGIEIYNGTGSSINLGMGNYSILLFTNDRDFTKIDLIGNIANNDVFVLANASMAGQITTADQTFANGNNYRTIVLLKDYTYQSIDTIFTGLWPETVQDDSLTDENQVRYGAPSGSGCPIDGTGFLNQSGFGFEGQADSTFEPDEGQYFPVGRFCHYNNPITTPSNAMDMVPLNLTINDIGCPPGQTLDPVGTPDDLTFTYNVHLVETPNTTSPCAYGENSPNWPGGDSRPNIAGDIGPNRNGCADRVLFSALGGGGTQEFTCRIDPQHYQDYTVSILGFVPTTAGAACPDTPAGTIQFNQIYTAETAKNCYCVYAAYTRGQITPVVLQNLSAVSVENGVLISWETVTETNNFGFNIMRAESKDGEQTQVNPEMIMSQIAPGDMFGASYEYLDSTAAEGVTYYYWLVDVPLDSADLPGIHGPISVTR